MIYQVPETEQSDDTNHLLGVSDGAEQDYTEAGVMPDLMDFNLIDSMFFDIDYNVDQDLEFWNEM